MSRMLSVTVLVLILNPFAVADVRLTDFKNLTAEFDSRIAAFNQIAFSETPTLAERIRHYEAFPLWEFVPRVVELAKEKPEDATAFACCRWIIERTDDVGNRTKLMHEADQKAWRILTAHHAESAEAPALCIAASHRPGAAREEFLRALLGRSDLSRENRGVATIALAESLAKKVELIEHETGSPRLSPDEFRDYLSANKHPEYDRDLILANQEKFKAESIGLFRIVLDQYADVPMPFSAPGFRNIKNLGEKASKSLHALEHLMIGAAAPNTAGTDLKGKAINLRDHHGKVVVLVFWFTGCGPCMGMIPQEKRLIETYKDREFALLSVCTDETVEQGVKTAADHGMDWPCWFDGQNGPIARDWNVLSWPAIYILDRNGVIVAKDLRGESLDAKIAELLPARK